MRTLMGVFLEVDEGDIETAGLTVLLQKRQDHCLIDHNFMYENLVDSLHQLAFHTASRRETQQLQDLFLPMT